jgi:hypothetical protein
MDPAPTARQAAIALVVPVWNDAARLARFGPSLAAELAASPLPVRWIIADDGSDPADRAALATLRDQLAATYPAVEIHWAARHRGKGAVVREAWTLAPDAAWLAFADADGSVTAAEMVALIARAVADGRSTLAARVTTATTRVESSPGREFMHHAYLFVARWWLGLHSLDLQCGAKVIKGDDYRIVAPALCEEGWAFDSEMLLAMHHRGMDWQEIPVNWTAQAGGKIKPVRDAIRMFAALWRIKRRLQNA